MSALNFTAGQLVTAAELNLLVPIYVLKGSNQVVTNSTVLVNDNDITFTLAPNQSYAVDINLQVVSSATAHGISVGYAVTGTVAIVARSGVGPGLGTANTRLTTMNSVSFTNLGALTYGTDSQTSQVWEKLVFTSGASGGTVTMQWAQATAGAATTTTVGAGSHAIVRAVA